MRPLLLAVSLLAFIAGAACAADDPMTPFFGNTVITTGGMADLHSNYSADHTFVVNVPAAHMSFKGTWKLDGATMCRTFETAPPGTPNPLCTPFEAHKVGDSWSVTMDGKTRSLSLVPGIQ